MDIFAIEKDSDGDAAIVSVFDAFKGTPDEIDSTRFVGLQGTATYEGGAVGQFALRSSTGGTNDSGEFTAKATLNADFGGTTSDEAGRGDISGTIHDFKVGDSDKEWSVELKEGAFGAVAGGIVPLGSAPETVWTIGTGDDATAGDAGGSWMVHLRNDTENGDGNVPEVATGVFHSAFGADGNMVGAFGASLDK